MNNLSILTWNTQLYEQGNIIENTIKKIDIYNFMSIVKFIKNHLEQENSIVFLQEIPYCCNATWRAHFLYTKFKEFFNPNEYDVKWNLTSPNQIMMNVAISAPNTLILDHSNWNDNRTISVHYKGLNITGIHAKNGVYNVDYINKLSNNTAHVILGDFNSGDYAKSENRQTFNNLLKHHTCICNEPTTIYNTPIDHIFVDNNIVYKCSKPIVHNTIKFSDHFPVTFEIDF